MKTFFKSIRLHLFFIVLTQVLYTLIYIFKRDVLESYWVFLYNGICLFIYLAAGWVTMYETGKRLWTAFAGLVVFYVGYIAYCIGVLVVAPLIYHFSLEASLPSLPRVLEYSVYYALIATALSFIGGHICHQKQRFDKKQ